MLPVLTFWHKLLFRFFIYNRWNDRVLNCVLADALGLFAYRQKVYPQNKDFAERKKSIFNLVFFYYINDVNGFRKLLFYRTKDTRLKRSLMNDLYIDCQIIDPGGCYFHHAFSTFINARHIGKSCSFRNNTTVGEKKNGKPYIGDNVFVGPNVVIIGDITVGNNVIMGAGSVVTKSIPDNSVVAGNPARVISINNDCTYSI